VRVKGWGLMRNLARLGTDVRTAGVKDRELRTAGIGAASLRVRTRTEKLRSLPHGELLRVEEN
jgi:hypothetical protein